MVVAGNFGRRGVVAGFALQVPTSGLAPEISKGVLFASGTLYRPGSAPTLAAAPDDALSYLGYANGTGFYWTSSAEGDDPDDAVVGWVLTDGSNVLAVSSQAVAVGAAGSGAGGGGGVLPSTSAGSSVGITVPGGLEVMVASGGDVVPNDMRLWVHEITLTGNVTMQDPTTAVPAATFVLRIEQDATGGRTVTWASFYKGLSGFVLDTTASTYASLLFVTAADGASAMLLLVAMNGNPVA